MKARVVNGKLEQKDLLLKSTFKHGDRIYFMEDNKIKSGEIYQINTTSTPHWSENNYHVSGATNNPIRECEAFANREQLIASI